MTTKLWVGGVMYLVDEEVATKIEEQAQEIERLYKIIDDTDKAFRLKQKGYVAEIEQLRKALPIGIKWMKEWLAQDLCECEYGHTCGRDERMRELRQMEKALGQKDV